MIGGAIVEYLRTATATTAAVAQASYWLYAPSKQALPYVCVRQASSQRIAQTLIGAGAPRIYSVDIMCFAASQSAAWAVAEAVKTDLDNYRGVAGSFTIKRAFVENEEDALSPDMFEAGIFAVSLTFNVTV